jgi:hypothetical protein
MSQDQTFSLTPAEVQDHARAIATRLQREISAYGRAAGSAMEVDLIEIVNRNLELYLRALSTDRLPEPSELAEFEAVCGRRLRQGFPLEAIMRAGRLESQAMWEIVRVRAPDHRIAAMATLTLRYLDLINAASERGYIHARDALGRSMEEATRLFLTRLMLGNFADEVEAVSEATMLGFDLERFRVGVVVGPDERSAAGRSAVDLQLAQAATELSGSLPQTPWGLVESGLVLAVPAASPDEVADLVAGVLARSRTPGSRLIAGIGAPRVGSSGLKASFAEARRALALGSVLNPDKDVHRYDELRVFDLFKEDNTVESFVQEVLHPLLGLDHGRSMQTIETLDVFFTSGMVRKAAAARLQIHPNTLDYRLREIEAALGFPVRFGTAAFKLQLALKLLPLARSGLASGQPPGSRLR